jgi:histidinol-phosphatase (PHP family)
MIDIHIHSRFSFDSEELPENYIAKAQQLNIPVIGFSEHYDYDALLDGADIALADLPEYVAYINNLKRRKIYPKVLCGIEFGYSAAASERYKTLAEEYNFDYIINSVHTLPGRGDSYFSTFFDGKTVRQSYLDYFNAVLASVKADFDYQIIGHIGYVSRYCKGENSKINYCDYSEIFDEILTEIIKRDKCLEINTSSGNAGSEFLPDCDVIERYLKLGGKKLSFASDAHRVGDYLRKEQIVKDYLKSIGVSKLCYYENRKCVFYDIY